MYKFFVAAAMILLPACDTVRQDVYSSGGFVGRAYSKHLFPAVTHEQRFDRYLVSFMVLAPVVLETAEDGVQTSLMINLVNDTYKSLAELHDAATSCLIGGDNQSDDKDSCTLKKQEAGMPSAYSFESSAYDVQSDLYFLAKELIVNLDLDTSASDLARLDASGLLSLFSRFQELFPVARRGAATFRDSVVLMADTIHPSCLSAQSDTNSAHRRACRALGQQLSDRYRNGTNTGGEFDIKVLLDNLRIASAGHAWTMTAQQRRAAIFHVEKACDRAFGYQKIENDNNYSNCGSMEQDDVPESEERFALWSGF